VLQLEIAHAPAVHAAVAFANEHATPQPPQSVVVVVDVSQPSAGRWLQSE
jgi:hypothetical protein